MFNLLLCAALAQFSGAGPEKLPQWYLVEQDGVQFKVWGKENPKDPSKIDWDHIPVNMANRRAAIEARAAEAARAELLRKRNYGVDPRWPDRSKGGRKIYGSNPVAEEWAREALAREAEPPKLHLTVIGPHEQCKAVLDDLANNPVLQRFKDNLLVQEYNPGTPGAWAVQDLKFRLDGKPSIYIQAKDGSDYFHAMDYSCGAAGLAREIYSGLRRADPNYNPEAPADPTSPNKPSIKSVSPAVLFGGAGLGLLLILSRGPSRGRSKQ